MSGKQLVFYSSLITHYSLLISHHFILVLMDIAQFAALRLARYEFRLRARAETVLLSLLGATLRGAFGHAWKTVVCAAAPGVRAGCFLTEICQEPTTCRYSFFKPAARRARFIAQAGEPERKAATDLPPAYIFEPPAPPLTREISAQSSLKICVPQDGELPFRLTLLEQDQPLHDIINAVSLMAKRGLGASRAPFALASVAALDAEEGLTTIYEPDAGLAEPRAVTPSGLDELVARRMGELPASDRLTLRWLTPARIRLDRALRESFTCAELTGLLSRRARLLAAYHGARPLAWEHKELLEQAGQVATVRANLWRHKAARYTATRGEKLEQDGILGEISFRGAALKELWPLLVAGEYLHVGSSTSFGAGQYRLFAA